MKRILSSLLAAFPLLLLGQNTEDWISSPGIIGTIVLRILVLALAVIIFAARASSFLKTPSGLWPTWDNNSEHQRALQA